MIKGILIAALILSPAWGTLLYLWIQKRALIRVAKSYGIEYVPGEDLDKLCARVVKKRNEVTP
jgi:hypothetical protein